MFAAGKTIHSAKHVISEVRLSPLRFYLQQELRPFDCSRHLADSIGRGGAI